MTPPLVARAAELAEALGFENSCSPETGRLLNVLAGMRGRERVGETGTGVGYGAAWMVSALDPSVPFFSAELDEARAAAAAELFHDDEHVRVLAGDWHEVLAPHAPFDLLFHDGSKREPERDGEETLRLLAPRGLIVMDDLTLGRPGLDEARDFWLEHPDVAATEAQVSVTESVLIAVRTR